jgi:hypothetical protein
MNSAGKKTHTQAISPLNQLFMPLINAYKVTFAACFEPAAVQ